MYCATRIRWRAAGKVLLFCGASCLLAFPAAQALAQESGFAWFAGEWAACTRRLST